MNNEFIESGKAFYIVVILFTILACLCSGCEYNYAPEGGFVVEQIQDRGYFELCNYFIKNDDLVFVDTCGKWNIGDTINIIIK